MKLKKIRDYLVETTKAAARTVKDFAVGCIRHAETIIVLGLAAIGLNALLSELPFHIALPAWVESPLIIPVIAIVLVSLLVKCAERRAINRMA